MRFLFLFCCCCIISIPFNGIFAQSFDSKTWEELDQKMRLHYSKGAYDEAITCLNQAKELAKGHDSLYANTLNNLAYLNEQIGEYFEAEVLYLECLELDKKKLGVNNSGYASSLNNLGLLYDAMGRYKEAEPLYLKALNIRKKVLDSLHIDIAGSYNNIGTLYLALNKNKEALPYLKLALNIYRKHPHHFHYSPRVLNNIGRLFSAEKENELAKKYYLEALEIMKSKGGTLSPNYVTTLGNLASLYSKEKNYEKAISLHLETLELRRKTLGEKDPFYANSLQRLGETYSHAGKHYLARTLLHQAIQINSQYRIDSSNFHLLKKEQKTPLFTSNYIAIPSFIMLARIHRALYKETQAIEHLKAAYEVLSSASIYIQFEEKKLLKRADKLNLLRNNAQISALAIQTAEDLYHLTQEKSYLAEALTFAEHNKSAILSSTLASENALAFGEMPEELVQEEKAILKKMAKLEEALLKATSANDSLQVQKAQEQLAEANFKQNAFKKSIQGKFPKYSTLKYKIAPITVSDIQENLLSPNSALLEYFIFEETLKLLLVSKEDVQLISIELSQEELTEAIKTLRKSLSNYTFILGNEFQSFNSFAKTSHHLFNKLIAPILPALSTKNQLIIIPDGELGHIPFEVLLKNSVHIEEKINYKNLPYLIKDFDISYSYSSSLLLENKKSAAQQNNGKLLAFAAAYPDARNLDLSRLSPIQNYHRKSLAPLTEAPKEVAFLEEQFPNHSFYYGASSNERNFKATASDYAVLHFAMHGILNKEFPLLSALAFTEDGDTLEDNFLEAHEISQLNLNSDLVVLSACETGYGEFEQGEGILSLARSFMYAGVPSLVVSLWQVNDHSTSIIMKCFYQYLANGMTKDAALRQAKLEYLNNAVGLPAHPAFWSPFIQLGDSRAIQIETKGSRWFWVGSIALFIVLLTAFSIFKKKKRTH